MENNEQDNLEIFLKNKKTKKEYIDKKDGLLERDEILNKKFYTQDNRQLLKEVIFEK